MGTLVLLRHGQSQWNRENRFTGWVDVPLSTQGIQEAIQAGKTLKDLSFDVVFVSHMLRAVQTLHYVFLESSMQKTPVIYHDDEPFKEWEQHTGDTSKELPVYQHPALAERYYGDLQGLNKDETRKRYGDEQVHIWRRSYSVAPPGGESLRDTTHRTIPYFIEKIQPEVIHNKTVLISAHGNSIRSIVMHLEHISEEDIPSVEIPTGKPIQYVLDASMQILDKQVME